MTDSEPSGRSKSGKARWAGKTEEERKELMSKAAKARWNKVEPLLENKDVLVSVKTDTPVRRKRRKTKKASGPNIYGNALATAEKQLSEALVERDKHAQLWAYYEAVIPSLLNTIAALKNQQAPVSLPQVPYMPFAQQAPWVPPSQRQVTMEQVMSDAPLPATPTGGVLPVPQVSLPQISPKVGGGTQRPPQEPDDPNENAFLDETNDVTGGRGWA